MPERKRGFFIPDFVDGYFGLSRNGDRAWIREVAETWTPLASVDPSPIQRAFAETALLPHVALRDALHPHVADAIHEELERGPFRPHHHGPYPLHIAPLAALEPEGALALFCEWLQSREGVAHHRELVGWPRPLRTKQVQISRMRVGEFFPPHIDTDAQGLAVIYNFSRPWDPEHGGALAFPHPERAEHDFLVVPALFNSMFVFRTTRVLHRVTPIAAGSEGRSRYSITAFMLAD